MAPREGMNLSPPEADAILEELDLLSEGLEEDRLGDPERAGLDRTGLDVRHRRGLCGGVA
jgi:hypothetical protein